jgi:hypothetical protein
MNDMTEKQWEIDLQQIRQLMRNEVTNHDRIKDRVIHLRDLYAEGQVNDCVITWESWAVSYFANSPENLRRMLREHPNTIDRFARQQQKREEDAAKHQQKLAEAQQKQQQRAELAALKSKKPKTSKRTRQTLSLPKPRPTDPEMAGWIDDSEHIVKLSRVQCGALYAQMKEKVITHKAGKNPTTDKFWSWTAWAETFIPRSRVDIYKCIRENVASCNIEQINTADNVTQFPKTVA